MTQKQSHKQTPPAAEDMERQWLADATEQDNFKPTGQNAEE